MRIGLFSLNIRTKSQKEKFNLLFLIFKFFLFDSLKFIPIIFYSLANFIDSTFPFTIASQFTFLTILPFFNDIMLASLACPLFVLLATIFLHGFVKFSTASTIIFHSFCFFAYVRGSLGILLSLYYYKCAEILFIHGDVHPNPGPPTPNSHFKFMHWNLNSLPAHNFERCNNLIAYNSEHKFHLIAITESALKNSIPNDKINLDGYIPIRCDLPGNDTHGGVLIYQRSDISAKNRLDLCNLENTIVLELSISRKKTFFHFII